MLELFTLIPLDAVAILPMDAKPFDKVVADVAADINSAFRAVLIVAITIMAAVAVLKRGFSLGGLVTVAAVAAFATWLLWFDGIITIAGTLRTWMDNLTAAGS